MRLLMVLWCIPAGITVLHLQSQAINAIRVTIHSNETLNKTASADGLYRRRSEWEYRRLDVSLIGGWDVVHVANAVATQAFDQTWSLKQQNDDSWALFNEKSGVLASSSQLMGQYTRESQGTIIATVSGLGVSSLWSNKPSTTDAHPEIISTDKQLPSASLSKSHALGFRKNPNKTSQQQSRPPSPLYQLLTQTPATVLLISDNCLLFYIYWSRRVDPVSVAKIYSEILYHGQAWRSLSGATAHFEIWHIGFNMIALYGLGQELEGENKLYSSIGFLFLNLSLIPLTTCVWVGLEYLQSQFSRRNNNQQETHHHSHNPTVGYSGVLFAWMVVAALRQEETCPIPFLPQLCFQTVRIANMPLSLGPLVQLGVAQVILPRVSLSGHLAGLMLGFFMCWGLLPVELIQPAIVWPLIYLLYLKLIRKVIPSNTMRLVMHLLKGHSSSTNERLCLHILRIYVTSVVMGLIQCLYYGSGIESITMLLPSCFAMIYWAISCHHLQTDSLDHRDCLTRAFITTAVLTLLNDSMSFGSWWVVRAPCSRLLALLSLVRFLLLCAGVCLACHNLSGTSQGIFGHVFGPTILDPGRDVGKWLVSWTLALYYEPIHIMHDDDEDDDAEAAETESSTSWAPFVGQGRVLGSNRSVEMAATNSRDVSTLL
jgi:membrane associated rhomboid family serine protease